MRSVVLSALVLAFATNVPAQSLIQKDGVLQSVELNKRTADESVFITKRLETIGGTVRVRTNEYVQFQSGLNYKEEGVWKPSEDLIEIVPDGAQAVRGRHKVKFPSTTTAAGGVQITTEDGKVLNGFIVGLSYFDSSSGKSVELGVLKDVGGELIPPNRIVYRDAFTGLSADIVFTYTKAGLEQDVVLKSNPPNPAEFNLNPATTKIEAYTEFTNAPEPEKATRLFKQGNTVTNATMVEPLFLDETLAFGRMRMVPGKVFTLPKTAGNSSFDNVRVGKQWKVIDGRKILIEGVEYLRAKPHLDSLPAQKLAANIKETRSFASIPKTDSELSRKIQIAKDSALTVGLVIDYILIDTSTDYTFKENTTYVVTGQSWLYGTTTIEGGAVVKYTNNVESLALVIEGPVVCNTSPHNRAVFTAMDDDSVGETLPWSTGSPTNYYAFANIWIGDQGSHIKYIRSSYAEKGIVFDHDTIDMHFIAHSEFLHCLRGIVALNNFHAQNILMYDVRTNFYTTTYPATGTVEHGTFHVADVLNGSDASGTNIVLVMTNSIVSEVSSLGNGYSTNSDSVAVVSTNVFQTVGAGAHYLQNGSALRDAGTSNIDPALMLSLKSKTTFPPQILSTITSNTRLTPYAKRDADVPDLGYHYDPVDYAAGNVVITNSTLTIANGTVVGIYGSGSQSGFELSAGGHLETQICSSEKNLFIRYNMSQEQANGTWANGTMSTTIISTESGAGASLNLVGADFRGPVYHLCLMDGADTLQIRDSEFSSGIIDLSQSTVSVTNILSRNVEWHLAGTNLTASFANNLFLGGWVLSDWHGTSSVSMYDNFFHQTQLTDAAAVSHDYNAYIDGNDYKWGYSGSYDVNGVVVTNADFKMGPIGDFYLSSGSPLVDAGSQSAAAATLDAYTTQILESLDSSYVDIGFHYQRGATNLAIGGTASQSSTDFGGSASLAIDGNRNGDFSAGSVTHTSSETEPWWQVDLESTNTIDVVAVWSRTDCCEERLRDGYVFVSTAPFVTNTIAGTIAQSGVSAYRIFEDGPVIKLPIGRTGRYVRVQAQGTTYLHLAEVQVLAPEAANCDGNAPTVSLTFPSNNQFFATSPTNLTLTATASDSDGTISAVEFYVGTNLVGGVTGSPYAVPWGPVSPGTYTVYAKATDNDGLSSSSAVATITVNEYPSVTLTAPTDGQVFGTPGVNITLQATASDSDGSVTQVQFFNGGTQVGSDSTSPYSAVWSNVPAGHYTIQAKAIDDSGGVRVSVPIEITVRGENQAPVVNAGPAFAIHSPTAAFLGGSVTDDSLPVGGAVTSLWTKVSGPGTVTFTDSTKPATGATFSTTGTYVLKLFASDSQLTNAATVTITNLPANSVPIVDAGTNGIFVLPALAGTNFEAGIPGSIDLVTVAGGFNYPIGIDYHKPTGKIVVSENYPTGNPHNFELVSLDGTHTGFSSVQNLTDELKIGTVRETAGGFIEGQLFAGNGNDGEIIRISPDGSTVDNPWVTLPGGTNGLLRGSLQIDRTGIFGHDLIVCTTVGSVWRISSTGVATWLAYIGTHLEGLCIAPNDPSQYGPWAGKILIGAENEGRIYTVDVDGNVTPYELGLYPEDIDIIEPNQNFFGVSFRDVSPSVLGAPARAFQDMVGDILVVEENGAGYMWRVHWNGSAFEKTKLSWGPWEHVTFAPAGIVNLIQPGSLQLKGIVTDDGLPSAVTNASWMMVSGPSPAEFTDASRTNTDVRFQDVGTFVLRLIGTDGELSAFDDVTVTVVRNQAPVVDAGTNQTINISSSASLSGTVTDDGYPTSQLTNYWGIVSGPGTVTFGNSNQVSTTATFSRGGTYVLKLTSNDGDAIASDEVTITVNGPRITITPADPWPLVQSNSVTVTATFVDTNGNPIVGTNIDFTVDGANPTTITVQTDSNGHATWSYEGLNTGRDVISASATYSGNTITANDGYADWAEVIECGFGNRRELRDFDAYSPERPGCHARYFFMDVVAGSPIHIEAQTGSDMVVYVKNSSHEIIAMDDDPPNTTAGNDFFFTPTVTEQILIEETTYFPPLGGTYFIVHCESGTNPRFELLLNGTNVQNNATIDFGDTTPGTPATNTFSIYNSGDAELDLSSIDVAGDFEVVSAPATVSSGAVSNLVVRFNASTSGTFSGYIFVSSTDSGTNNPFLINITGLAAPSGTPPSVAIAAPADHAIFAAPSDIPLEISAASDTSTIASVDVYNGPTVIAHFSGTPFSATWSNVPAGEYTVTARATDANGRVSVSSPVNVSVAFDPNSKPIATNDTYTIFVNSPAVTFSPLTNDFDADGDLLRIIAIDPAQGGTASIINNGTAIRYQPTPFTAGQDGFRYTVEDGRGGTARAWVIVNINDSDPPSVAITSPADETTFSAGATVTLTASASDSDGSIDAVDFFIDGEKVGSDSTSPYSINWNGAIVGDHQIVAVATDNAAKTEESSQITIHVTPASGDHAPIAAISNVTNYIVTANGSSFTNTAIVREGYFTLLGTADDPDGSDSVSYRVRLLTRDGAFLRDFTPAPTNSSGFHSGRVTSGILTTNDLTTLQNDTYKIELAVRGGYQETLTNILFVLESGAKVGPLSFSETDLSIPVNGVPLTIIRTYNSLNPNDGSFGYSWTYAVNDLAVSLTEDRQDAIDFETEEHFSRRIGGTRDVTLTLPDGHRATFFFYYEPGPSDDGVPCYCYYARWAPAPGVHAALEPMGDPTIYAYPGGQPFWQQSPNEFLDNYDFPGFTLTLQNGTKYEILRDDLNDHHTEISPGAFSYGHAWGAPYVSRIISRSGDYVQIGDQQITHYNPTNAPTRSIVLDRDEVSGRIRAIYDPNSLSNGIAVGFPLMKYDYDNDGNLIAAMRLNDRTLGTYWTNQYHYENRAFPHYITAITDARGVKTLKNVFDESGHIIGMVDAAGKTNVFAHDLQGSTDSVYDRAGNPTAMLYDNRGNITQVTDPLNGTTKAAYDDENKLLWQVDQLGHTNFFGYDARGFRNAVTNALGEVTRFTLNTNGQVLTATDPRQNVTSNGYDAFGNLIATTNALQQVTRFNYNERNLLTSQIDPLGVLTTNRYDEFGNITNVTIKSTTETILQEVVYAYDSNNNRTNELRRRTTPSGIVYDSTSFVFDPQNRTIQTINALGQTNHVVFTPTGAMDYQIDALGNKTSFQYDARNRLTKTTYADGSVEMTGYDDDGTRSSTTNRLGYVTRYIYDALGRLIQTILPDGGTNRVVLDAAGRLFQSIDAMDGTNSFGYDDVGRRTAMTNAVGTVTRFGYDAAGNQVQIADGLGNTTTNVFDALNHLVETHFADGSSQTNYFDAVGNRLAVTDQNGKTVWFGYDGLSRLASVTNAAVSAVLVTSYQYDETGNLIAQTDSNGHVTDFEYDALRHKVKRILPPASSGGPRFFERFTYDGGGRLTNHVDFNDRTNTFVYDSMGRLRKKTYDPSVADPALEFGFNAAGQKTWMLDASGETIFRFNERGWLTNKIAPAGALLYTYDKNGNVLSLSSSHANGIFVVYQWDKANRLTNVIDTAAGGTAYEYDSAGNLQTLTYPNSIATTYQYDQLNRTTNVAVGSVAQFSYTLAAGGQRLTAVEQITGASSLNRTVTYGYDGIYRLTNEVSSASAGTSYTLDYTYDSVGNRLARTSNLGALPTASYSYDWMDRASDETYDNNGNTTAAGADTFTFDSENRLSSKYGVASYVYDGDGNRVMKATGAGGTRYLVDDRNPTGYAQVVEEVSDDNPAAVKKVWVYGHRLISETDLTTAATRFFAYDAHGSVRVAFDASGGVTDWFAYEGFGTIVDSYGTNVNTMRFSGEYWDADLGMYYLRARHMNPTSGRFVALDFADGNNFNPPSLHKYVYGQNDPVNRIDPSGNESLIDVSVASTISTSLESLYNGTDLVIQQSLQATLFGVQQHKTANQILVGYYTDVAIGVGIGVAATKIIGIVGEAIYGTEVAEFSGSASTAAKTAAREAGEILDGQEAAVSAAAADQVSGLGRGYGYIDKMLPGTLKEGNIIYSTVPPDKIRGGLWATDARGMVRAAGSSEAYRIGTQTVKPRDTVYAYRVKTKLPCAAGNAEWNYQNGEGGFPQFYIRKEDVGSLEKVADFPLQ